MAFGDIDFARFNGFCGCMTVHHSAVMHGAEGSPLTNELETIGTETIVQHRDNHNLEFLAIRCCCLREAIQYLYIPTSADIGWNAF
jgi:hypothetical protein